MKAGYSISFISSRPVFEIKILFNKFLVFAQDIIDNQAVPDFAMYLLPTLYSLVIMGSVIGNVLVITAVLRSPNMRKVTTLGVFINYVKQVGGGGGEGKYFCDTGY